MGKFEDLTGKRFNKLIVIKRNLNYRKGTYWDCICDCGNKTIVNASNLKTGHTKSCGCYSKELTTVHNMSNTKLYNVWQSMKRRCNCKNKNSRYYKDYTSRNIKVYDEWYDFEIFHKWSIENGYKEGLTIDRIDNDGNYEPSNCRWITNLEQQNNKRNNHLVKYNNKIYTVAQLSRELSINYNTLMNKVNKGKYKID